MYSLIFATDLRKAAFGVREVSLSFACGLLSLLLLAGLVRGASFQLVESADGALRRLLRAARGVRSAVTIRWISFFTWSKARTWSKNIRQASGTPSSSFAIEGSFSIWRTTS